MMPRWVEIILSILILFLLSPLFVFIAVLIKLDSSGPVFYLAKRVGYEGHIFKMYKFRTMVNNASKIGPPITTQQDHRITRVGRFLRAMKLDEFPQFLNVLKGEMRLVGPRPEDPHIVEQFTSDQRHIFNYKPGITSPASVQFRTEESLIPPEFWEERYLNDILPRKIACDLKYMQTATFLSDIKVIWKTLSIL